MSKLNDEERIELSIHVLKELIDEAVGKGRETVHTGKNYYAETEVLLYNYPALKKKVEADEEFLYNPEADASASRPCRSKDIVLRSTKVSHGLSIDNYTQGVKSSMMRTKQEVLRIERALATIKDDQYYDIIPQKYFDNRTFEEISNAFECDERTVRRNKNRLIKSLMIMLFGADALTNLRT